MYIKKKYYEAGPEAGYEAGDSYGYRCGWITELI